MKERSPVVFFVYKGHSGRYHFRGKPGSSCLLTGYHQLTFHVLQTSVTLVLFFRSLSVLPSENISWCAKSGKFIFVVPRQWVPLGPVYDFAAWSLPVILEDDIGSSYVHLV